MTVLTDDERRWHCRIGIVKRRGNVHLFPGVYAPELPAEQQPNWPLIECLEDVLARARSGEVQAVGIAGVKADETTFTIWRRGGYWCSSLMAGAMLHLLFNYAAAAREASHVESRYD